MARIWKEIGRPGRYHTPDGLVTITAERLQHWHSNAQAMISEGLPIPLPWEHQEEAVPRSREEWLRDRAKLNAGFVDDTEFRGEEWWGLLDIPDEEEYKRVVENVRFVSLEAQPEWIDGQGRPWRDVVTHIALTARPIDHKQKPFSAADRLSHEVKSGRVRLSLENLEGVSHMAEEKPEDEVEKEAESEAPKKKKPESADGPSNDEEYLEEIKDLLGQLGVPLPDHTSPKTFMRDMCVALHAVVHGKPEMEGAAGGGGYGGAREETPVGVTMSHEAMPLAERLAALQKQNTELLKKEALRDLEALEADEKINPRDAKRIRGVLTRERMSFGGSDLERVLIEMNILRSNRPGSQGTGQRRTGQARLSHEGNGHGGDNGQGETSRTPWGSEDGEALTRERALEVAQEQMRNSGILPPSGSN